MITASHMPSEYNGLKITIEDSKPVSADVLQILKEIVGTHTFSSEETIGSITTHAMQEDWIANFKANHDLSGTGFSVVIDPANMIGALEIATFKAFEPDLTVHSIHDEFDHSCPNHEANPMKYETMADLGAEVVCHKANLGLAFDGDADRVGFVDENGKPVPSDIIGCIIAKHILATHPECTIVYDIRSTKALPELIESAGGRAIQERVGHIFIRTAMRKHDAILGIELSGHFFFKESYFSEGGPLPAFMVMEVMKKEGKTLSELATEVSKYFHSGEVNSEISRKPEEIYTELREVFADAEFRDIDGLSIHYADWWCNIRLSANDPVMRMNLEADTPELLAEKRDQVLKIIRS
jgi:phosphomannomutase